MAGLPQFPISTQTDPYWEIPMYDAVGNPLSIEGRVFEAWIAPAQTKQGVAEPVEEIKVLTFQDGLTLVPPTDGSGDQTVKNTLVHQVSREFAQAKFPRGELTADLLEVVDGSRRLFAPVRLFYADPAQIREFVADRQGITFGQGRQPIVTPVAIAGQKGRRGAGFITGQGAPTSSDGEDGDYWIDAAATPRQIYGPKTNGTWPDEGETFVTDLSPELLEARDAAQAAVGAAESEAERAIAAATSAAQVSLNRTYETLLSELAGNPALAVGTVRQVLTDPNSGTYELKLINGTKTWERKGATVPGLDARQAALSARRDADAIQAAGLFGGVGSPSIIPVLADAANKILIGVNASTGALVAVIEDAMISPAMGRVLAKGVYPQFENVWNFLGEGPVYPILMSADRKVVLGFDRDKAELVGLFPSFTASGGPAALTPLATADKPVLADWNGVVAYGQSLSIGAKGQPPLSTTQPYANLTFGAGPKAGKAGSTSGAVNPGADTSKPLVEDTASADGGGDRGETICSGLANGACELLAAEKGVSPSSHVIFASAAGRGATAIAGLSPGAAWYQQFKDHVTDAKALATAAGKTYALHAVPYLQGETDLDNGAARSTYFNALTALVAAMDADARAITGQAAPVHTLLYQTAYGARDGGNICLAQLDVAQGNPLAHLVTPIYHLPYSDGTHLTNIGYLWLGRYYARAYKTLVIDGCEPPSIRPISATVRGVEVRVRFRVPRLPLVLDSAGLAATLNSGFVVRDDSGDATIASVAVPSSEPDTVLIRLSAPLAGANPRVRYALDNLGTGLNITLGASGNLRDATRETFTRSGTTYPLWHVAPHFELPLLTLAVS